MNESSRVDSGCCSETGQGGMEILLENKKRSELRGDRRS